MTIETETQIAELAAALAITSVPFPPGVRARAGRLFLEREHDAIAAERTAELERHAAKLAELDAAEAGEITSEPEPKPARADAYADVARCMSDMPKTAGDLVGLTGATGPDISRALAKLKAEGKARTIEGTRKWVAVVMEEIDRCRQ